MEASLGRRFIKGLLATGFGTLVTLVFGFLNIAIAARCIPKAEFGIFLIIQTIVFSLTMVADLGINISSVKFIAESDEADKAKVASAAVIMRSALLVVTLILILLAKPAITRIFKFDALSQSYYYIPLLFVLESYNSLLLAILQGCQKFRKMAAAQVQASIINAALIVTTVAVIGIGFHGLILARVGALAVAILYQIRASELKIAVRPDPALAKAIVKFGFFLGLNNVLSFVFMRIDTLIIGALTNPIGVALYGAAQKIPDASRQMFESFRSVFFPNVAELFGQKRHQEAEAILNHSLRLVSFSALFMVLTIMLFQDTIVRIFFSAKYLECAPVLCLLMIALSIGLIGNVLGTSLVAAGHPRLPVLINVVDATVCVIANLILIPRLGMKGAAYAAILARVVTNPVNLYFVKASGIGVRASAYLKPVVIFAVSYALFTVNTGMYRFLSLACYLVCSACFFVITGKDVADLKRLFLRTPQPADSKQS